MPSNCHGMHHHGLIKRCRMCLDPSDSGSLIFRLEILSEKRKVPITDGCFHRNLEDWRQAIAESSMIINRRSKLGEKLTLLDEVEWNRDIDNIKSMISEVDLNARINNMGTLLHIAARNDPNKIIDISKLLEQDSKTADYIVKDPSLFLYSSCLAELSRRIEVIETLISRSADVVDVLIRHGADVNARNEQERTPLHEAAVMNDSFFILDIDLGRNQDLKSKLRSKSLLDAASRDSALRSIKLLVNNGADVNAVDAYGFTPLHKVIEHLYESPDCIKLLLEHKADVNAQATHYGDTPLHLAVTVGSLEAVKMLLEHGADANVENKERDIPLVMAINDRNSDIVEALLKHGVNADVEHKTGETALLKALEGKLVRCVESLLEHGANANAKNKIGKTALHIAVRNESPECVKLLLEHGANANAKNEIGKTALHIAVRNELPECVKFLLVHGANPNLRDDYGHTPLYFAVLADKLNSSHGSGPREIPNLVKMLVEHGADINARFEYWDTPLHIATKSGLQRQIRILLELGAKVNACNKFYNTPLHVLFDSSVPLEDINGILNLMWKNGANLHSKNIYGKTPARVACDRLRRVKDPYMLFVITELLSLGANFNAEDNLGLTCYRMIVGFEQYVPDLLKGVVVDYIKLLIKLGAVDMVKKNRLLFREIVALSRERWDETIQEYNTKSREVERCGQDYNEKCVFEIQKLKTIQIYRNVTLGDILTLGDPVTMSNISVNINFRLYVESEDLEDSFPLYSFLIRYQYQKSSKFKLLCERSEISLSALLPKKLNRECYYEILQYLSEIEMDNLNEAMNDIQID